jgi:branched-chain amino acid transport system ATP-binding protein
VLALEGVTCRYGGVEAVSTMTLTIPQHQVYGIVGPNGAGKTTLLNLICGLARPVAGRILLDDERIDRLPAYRIARRGIARTFQQGRLLREQSVLEQLIVAQQRRGSGRLWQELTFSALTRAERALRRQRAEALLDLAQLRHVAASRVARLSAGEQRRLEVARALAQAPTYLLLDEPTAGMPERELQAFHRLLMEVMEGGVTVVLAEHDINLVMAFCDRMAVLQAGRLLVEGLVREIQADPATLRADIEAVEA